MASAISAAGGPSQHDGAGDRANRPRGHPRNEGGDARAPPVAREVTGGEEAQLDRLVAFPLARSAPLAGDRRASIVRCWPPALHSQARGGAKGVESMEQFLRRRYQHHSSRARLRLDVRPRSWITFATVEAGGSSESLIDPEALSSNRSATFPRSRGCKTNGGFDSQNIRLRARTQPPGR